MKKQIEKWKQKSLFSKITDGLFILFIVAMLIPASRTRVLTYVNRVKSKIIQPRVKDEIKVSLSAAEYDWQLADIDGNVVNMSEFKDKVIFINFWATWCGPCIGEMPEIQKFYDKFKNNNDVVFIIASTDDLATMKDFMSKKDYTFPVYSIQSEVPAKLEHKSIPNSFLIDKNGGVAVHTVGAANWGGSKIERTVNELINNK